MFTVAFYSYKGGVGRTLALVNAASRLLKAGNRVFVLDFDLEAPGLDSFDSNDQNSHAGVVEYFSEFLETQNVPDIEKYVTDLRLSDGATVQMMSSGRKDAEYQRKLSSLDWKFLYRQKDGFLF